VTVAVEQLGALLRQSGDLDLPTLTDDELAALSPLRPPYAHIVPLGTLLEIEADDWPDHARAGERSLVDRGLLLEGKEGLLAVDELRAVLLAREQPSTVTILEVTAGRETVWSGAFYGSGTDEFRVEEHTDGAEHRFLLRDPGAAALDLARTIDPEGRAARTTDDVEAADEGIKRAERRVRLLSVRRTGEEEVEQHEAQLVVGERGVWLVAGLVNGDTGETELVVRPLGPSTLVETLRQYVVAASD
jgi:hypothetical protein